MSDVTHILSQIESGDPTAPDQLLPLVYEELRRLAAAKLAQEKPGQTLQPTALVHEAYLKLVESEGRIAFANRRHFIAAAARAMRQILVDRARSKLAVRHGGLWQRIDTPLELAEPQQNPAVTIGVDELLNHLAVKHPRPFQVAQMRLYLQMTFREIAEVLEMSADTAETDWAYARAWLMRAWRSS